MDIVEKEFQKWFTHLYPTPMPSEQKAALKTAFFCGTFIGNNRSDDPNSNVFFECNDWIVKDIKRRMNLGKKPN